MLGYIISPIIGFSFGYLFQLRFPRAYASGGKWLWLVALSLMLVLVLIGGGQWKELFIPKGPAGIVYVLYTLPLLGTGFYSLGTILASRGQRKSAMRPTVVDALH